MYKCINLPHFYYRESGGLRVGGSSQNLEPIELIRPYSNSNEKVLSVSLHCTLKRERGPPPAHTHIS